MTNIKYKRIVCLANSRKLSGRCIAGREWTEEKGVGKWIRPVSERENQEVSEYERQYDDGSDPQVLDIIDVPVLEPQPMNHQSENWLLNPKFYWKKAGSYPRLNLQRLADPVEPLWIDGDNTYHGKNDRISSEFIEPVSNSLRLVRIEKFTLKVFSPGEDFGNPKRRVQGQFVHSGQKYALWVTDPEYERRYRAKGDGNYEIGECYLTISLGEPLKGDYYKLIAAIIRI